MAVVACSDGNNGLMTRYGWRVQGDYARFPYMGGSSTVARWNSPNVGIRLPIPIFRASVAATGSGASGHRSAHLVMLCLIWNCGKR